MNYQQDEAVGRTVAAIVRKDFEALDLAQGMPATRISGFTASEAAVMVRVLDGFAIPGVGSPVNLVVCADMAIRVMVGMDVSFRGWGKDSALEVRR